MAYSQSFGLNRNSSTISSSPLNRHTITHCGEGSKNSDGECVGFEYYQKKDAEDKKKALANKALQEKTGPLTDAEQTKKDKNMILAVSKGEAEWARDGKSWSTYPIKERPNAWSLPNAKNPDGTVSDNTFSEEDLNKAGKAVELQKKQDMLGVSIDPETGEKIPWKDNPRNPNAGYKQGFDETGKAIHNSRGDKMYLGDKDVTEEYYKKHNKAGGLKQTFSNNLNSNLDVMQDALGIGGFAGPYGAFADGANALVSGGRGIASFFGADSGDGTTTSGHFKNMLKSGVYAIPVAGDIAAATKLNKYNKYLKNIPGTKKYTDYMKGNNMVTKNIGKTNKTKFNYNPQPMTGASKNWETKSQNLLRGGVGFLSGKNYNQFGNLIDKTIGKGGIADLTKKVTSSKFLLDKPQNAFESIKSGFTNTTNAGMDSIRNAFTGIDSSKIAQGGNAIKKDENENPATSIIASNNNKSNINVGILAP